MTRKQLDVLYGRGGKLILLSLGMLLILWASWGDTSDGPIWLIALSIAIMAAVVGLGLFLVGLVKKPDKTL